jgi:uncharacterized protein YprB with RNaseH-like and TPR domain/predicted phosphodiesterase
MSSIHFLALSDVHGNVEAVKSVVQEVRESVFDGIIFAGDFTNSLLTGDFAKANEDYRKIMELLLSLGVPVYYVLGNRDYVSTDRGIHPIEADIPHFLGKDERISIAPNMYLTGDKNLVDEKTIYVTHYDNELSCALLQIAGHVHWGVRYKNYLNLGFVSGDDVHGAQSVLGCYWELEFTKKSVHAKCHNLGGIKEVNCKRHHFATFYVPKNWKECPLCRTKEDIPRCQPLSENRERNLYVLTAEPEKVSRLISKLELIEHGQTVKPKSVKVVRRTLWSREVEAIKVSFHHPKDMPPLRHAIRNIPGVKELYEHDPSVRRYPEYVPEYAYLRSELTSIPLVGYPRAGILESIGITKISEIARIEPKRLASCPEIKNARDPSFAGQIPMIINYAKSIVNKEPMIVGTPPIFRSEHKNVYFFDIEYDLEGTKSLGKVGVFLIGLMNSNGEIIQNFLEEPEKEKELLLTFDAWVRENNPTLITFSSTSADEPQLRDAYAKFGVPYDAINSTEFIDLFCDVIFTQLPEKQMIFLPIKKQMTFPPMDSSIGAKPMSAKSIASYFGYREPRNLQIHDGLQALAAYKEYLRSKNSSIKEQLLLYNRCDLERTALIYGKLLKLFNRGRSSSKTRNGIEG